MREFFRGWRRKLGVVTLGLALLVMGWWIRSLYSTDGMTISCEKECTLYQLVSIDSSLAWKHSDWSANRSIPIIPLWETVEAFKLDEVVLSPGTVRFRWWGFYIVDLVFPERTTRWWIVPYWSIVIPLTLLSAFLLLSTPQPATPVKATESTPEKVV